MLRNRSIGRSIMRGSKDPLAARGNPMIEDNMDSVSGPIAWLPVSSMLLFKSARSPQMQSPGERGFDALAIGSPGFGRWSGNDSRRLDDFPAHCRSQQRLRQLLPSTCFRNFATKALNFRFTKKANDYRLKGELECIHDVSAGSLCRCRQFVTETLPGE